MSGFWEGKKGIDWCENNYEHSFYIAETWNTVSNLAFVVAGVAGRRLAQQMNLPNRFYALSWSLIFLGLTSGSFHATLLWTHQKLDESFENMAMIVMFHIDKQSQVLSILHSLFTAFGVFTFGFILFAEVHLVGIVLFTLYKVHSWVSLAEVVTKGKHGLWRAVKIAATSAAMGGICWLIDRLACVHVSALAFNPQLHAWWHLFCAVALYEGFVLAATLYKFKQTLEDKDSNSESIESSISLPLVVQGPLGLDFPSELVNLKQV